MKKFTDGIYAHSCIGGNNQLVFRRAVLNGKLYLAYVKQNKLIALRDWEEVVREMKQPGPCLQLRTKGGKIDLV